MSHPLTEVRSSSPVSAAPGARAGAVETGDDRGILSSLGGAWRDVVLPKEHGSWSLAFEPVALGLLAAPSRGGAWLAVAVAAAFFARRPLRISWLDPQPARRATARRALAVCGAIALVAGAAAVGVAGGGWLIWVAPTALAGAVFLAFDLRSSGRAAAAEILGAGAFGFMPAAFAALAGWPAASALALAALMLGRTVPTVLGVRACLRAGKTGVWHIAPALTAAGAALVVGVALAQAQLLSRLGVGLLAVLALRTFILLVFPRPVLRARTLGMIEAVVGVGFVLFAGLGGT